VTIELSRIARLRVDMVWRQHYGPPLEYAGPDPALIL